MQKDGERDFIGYGAKAPDIRWPNGARLAVSFVLNYEEGAENSPLEGDPTSEGYLHEIIGAPPTVGQRNTNTESMYDFGARVGFWRLHRIFTQRRVPLTVFAVGQALERNPAAASAMADAGWEVASHGWRWIDYQGMPEEEERRHIRKSLAVIRALTGKAPLGWYTGRISANTRRLAIEEAGILYDSDSYADELPYFIAVAGKRHLILPYTLDVNDFKYLLPGGFVKGSDFLDYACDALEQQAGEERPSLLSIGLHCRISGRPGRARALARLLDLLAGRKDLWIATREEIARHWLSLNP